MCGGLILVVWIAVIVALNVISRRPSHSVGWAFCFGLAPEVLEPIRRKLGIAHSVLDIAMPQVGLQGSGIVALIRQGEAASMPQHMRMGFEAELCGLPSPLNHPCKSRSGKRCSAFAGEHER